MKNFIDILKESKNDEYNKQELREIYNDILELSGKYKSVANGAADFYKMNLKDRQIYFNKIILPILIKLDRPRWMTFDGKYLKFQDTIIKIWRNIK